MGNSRPLGHEEQGQQALLAGASIHSPLDYEVDGGNAESHGVRPARTRAKLSNIHCGRSVCAQKLAVHFASKPSALHLHLLGPEKDWTSTSTHDPFKVHSLDFPVTLQVDANQCGRKKKGQRPRFYLFVAYVACSHLCMACFNGVSFACTRGLVCV